MEEVLLNAWSFIISIIFWATVKIVSPKLSYRADFSKIYAIIVTLIFSVAIIVSLILGYWFSFVTEMLIIIIMCTFLYAGSRSVPFKTMTGVFSQVKNTNIGKLRAGDKNWVDPVFEYTTVDTTGVRNIAADLQHILINIEETKEIRTSKPGVTAYVFDIVFKLHLIEDRAQEIFLAEGGGEIIRERITYQVNEIVFDLVSSINPDDLDTNKKGSIGELKENLQKKINDFCDNNELPYHSQGEITIGDIALDQAYYNQQRLNVEIEQRTQRVLESGQTLLGKDADKAKVAETGMLIHGFISKNITEEVKVFTIDNATLIVAERIAGLFVKK